MYEYTFRRRLQNMVSWIVLIFSQLGPDKLIMLITLFNVYIFIDLCKSVTERIVKEKVSNMVPDRHSSPFNFLSL